MRISKFGKWVLMETQTVSNTLSWPLFGGKQKELLVD